ncbi:MAG: phosphohistidine phosphatase SixA [Candidatus Omnitrophica bacterium]|nr:phosphohistidine phosphatase SixA [Candidatus Omnitrophota bacterium]
MKLYLIQHGLFLPEDVDPQKALSEEGREETLKIAKFLKTKNIKATVIWHSKKLRSVQTAKILFEHIPNTETQERSDLNPLDAVDKFPEEIRRMNNDLIIVGHMPFLQRVSSLLLAGAQDFDLVSFRYSGVLCLERIENWRIAWFVTPDIVSTVILAGNLKR